jgi:hypothetical protein
MASIARCRTGCAQDALHIGGAVKAVASVSTSEKAIGLNTKTLYRP